MCSRVLQGLVCQGFLYPLPSRPRPPAELSGRVMSGVLLSPLSVCSIQQWPVNYLGDLNALLRRRGEKKSSGSARIRAAQPHTPMHCLSVESPGLADVPSCFRCQEDQCSSYLWLTQKVTRARCLHRVWNLVPEVTHEPRDGSADPYRRAAAGLL